MLSNEFKVDDAIIREILLVHPHEARRGFADSLALYQIPSSSGTFGPEDHCD
jgi:hypothetical protein